MTKQNHQQQQSLPATVNNDLIREIFDLPESEFWSLISLRLNIPSLSLSRDHVERVPTNTDVKDREHWIEEYLIEEVFLRLAGTKILVKHDGKHVTVYKYYHRAFQLRKWIPIAKPTPEFVIDASDLTVRLVSELKALDEDGSKYVLKQAVGHIFENIDSRQYHLSIARKLKVILQS
jgi:hypothetical protein